MKKHAPGPWTHKHGLLACGSIAADYGIATVWDIEAEKEAKSEANARLIAAAPEILEALKAAQSALAMMTAPDAIRTTSVQNAWAQAVAAESTARAALARAEGRT